MMNDGNDRTKSLMDLAIYVEDAAAEIYDLLATRSFDDAEVAATLRTMAEQERAHAAALRAYRASHGNLDLDRDEFVHVVEAVGDFREDLDQSTIKKTDIMEFVIYLEGTLERHYVGLLMDALPPDLLELLELVSGRSDGHQRTCQGLLARLREEV